MNKSNFHSDAEFERASIEYIKSNKILECFGFTDINYIEDKKTQIKGIDVIAALDEHKVNIDVKSVASMIPTFSQEIANCSSGKVGWIMNNELETDYYLYVWHNVGDIPYSNAKSIIAQNYNNIFNSDCVLVEKKAVQEFIQRELGVVCNEEMARKILTVSSKVLPQRNTVYFIIHNHNLCWGIKRPKGYKIYITRSDNIKERPLNFILRKSDLEKIGMLIKIK